MSFSNKNQFSESSAVSCLGVCSVHARVCECVRGRRLHQLQHLFTSKKTTVFSNCLLYCMGACINWSNSESQCGFTKNIYKGIRTSFFFSFFRCCWLNFFFVCVGPGAWDFRSLCCNMVRLRQTPKALALGWPHHNSDS